MHKRKRPFIKNGLFLFYQNTEFRIFKNKQKFYIKRFVFPNEIPRPTATPFDKEGFDILFQ
jgi:hypothetical protein